jgi:hypothetical protein
MNIFKFSIIISIICSAIIFSQSSSTYTRFGIGDINYTYSARSLGLGQTGAASVTRGFVELLNPASWAGLKLTRVEFSLVLNGVELSTNTKSALHTDADFKGFTFAFPISTKSGIGFASGLLPYSRISYNVVQTNVSNDPDISDHTTTYQGDGGLSRLFMGASYIMPFDWIIGATLEYYFGKQTYSSMIEFDNPLFLSSEFESSYRSTGFGTTIGLISQNFAGLLNNESISNLRFGFSVNLISDLDTDTSLTINPETVADTVRFGKAKMSIPFRINGGISLHLKGVYKFNLDYIFQPWTKYSLGGVSSQLLRDVHKFSFGFEYAPQRELGMTNWEQIMWRAGLSYELTQYLINGNDITQYSVFAGLSFPVGIGNTLDLGLEYSLRGTTDSGLIRENFYRINVGFSFGELWFQRVQK